jgi:SP family facilitated glucose transporter-like MFS transporter 8
LLVINVPYFVGFLLIITAPSINVLFLANILLGATIGLSEAPINSYFGEICQPELRSILAGSAGNTYSIFTVPYILVSVPKMKGKRIN